jgi:hypothetical protein
MSDTPETDAVYKIHPCDIYDYIPLEFARKLERERDQARDRQWVDAIHSCHNECARPMCVLRRERDEWREKAEHLTIACKVWEDAAILQPPARNCRECCGQGQVEIQSGPYMTQCTECNGTGKQTKPNE